MTRPASKVAPPAPVVEAHFYCNGCDGMGDIHGETCSVCRGSGHQPITPHRPAPTPSKRAKRGKR